MLVTVDRAGVSSSACGNGKQQSEFKKASQLLYKIKHTPIMWLRNHTYWLKRNGGKYPNKNLNTNVYTAATFRVTPTGNNAMSTNRKNWCLRTTGCDRWFNLICAMTWMSFTCITLRERSRIQKITNCRIPFTWHSGRDNRIGIIIIISGTRDRELGRELKGREIFYMSIMVLVTQLHTFIKTPKTIIRLLMDNSMICKLYFNKPDFTVLAGKAKKLKKKNSIRKKLPNEMAEWHHWLDIHEFEQALGVGEGQGSLTCYSPWGHKELDMTELNWTEGRNLVGEEKLKYEFRKEGCKISNW